MLVIRLNVVDVDGVFGAIVFLALHKWICSPWPIQPVVTERRDVAVPSSALTLLRRPASYNHLTTANVSYVSDFFNG